MSDEDQILSRDEVLELLSQKAREGSTSAMIALERALRIGQDEPPDEDDFLRATDSGREKTPSYSLRVGLRVAAH